jgi:DNA-binding CsgD family transcriptional regulator
MEVLSPARAFVLLVDPDRHSLPALSDLNTVFGLTNAEGRLVIELQRGRSLSEAASRLNTTYETARTTLKQAFRKTGTSGQPDLLRLISKFRTASKR